MGNTLDDAVSGVAVLEIHVGLYLLPLIPLNESSEDKGGHIHIMNMF